MRLSKIVLASMGGFLILSGMASLTYSAEKSISPTDETTYPEPKCFIESTCVVKATKCSEGFVSQQAVFSRAAFSLKKSRVCVAYDGTMARFSTTEVEFNRYGNYGFGPESVSKRSFEQAAILAKHDCNEEAAYALEAIGVCQ